MERYFVAASEDNPKKEAVRAGRFARVRQDHAREMAEDYAEMILDLEGDQAASVRPAALARALGVSHVTVLRALERLTRDGILVRLDQGVQLSPRGRRLGESSRNRHRLVVAFLESLGVPPEVAAVDGEGIEHHVSSVTLECLADHLIRNGWGVAAPVPGIPQQEWQGPEP